MLRQSVNIPGIIHVLFNCMLCILYAVYMHVFYVCLLCKSWDLLCQINKYSKRYSIKLQKISHLFSLQTIFKCILETDCMLPC